MDPDNDFTIRPVRCKYTAFRSGQAGMRAVLKKAGKSYRISVYQCADRIPVSLAGKSADGDGETDITVTIETKCAHVRKMIAALEQPVDAYEACFVKPGQGPVYEAAVNLAHGACPVPAAVLKCIEAEAGLALPRGVSFEFTD